MGISKRKKSKVQTNIKPLLSQENCEVEHFIWEDINFKNREIEIFIKRTGKKFQPIECKNSMEGLNKIKEAFFVNHHGRKLYKLTADNKKIIITWSNDIQDILNLIDSAIEFYNFRYDRTKKTRFLSDNNLSNLTNSQIFKIFQHSGSTKEPYLKYLYSHHSEKYKLIPILEFIGNAEEESFLFRIEDRKGNLLVVWENLNPSRATYVFKIIGTGDQLKNILHYISEHEQAKRMFLRQEKNYKWAKENLGFVKFIEHEGLNSYKKSITQLL